MCETDEILKCGANSICENTYLVDDHDDDEKKDRARYQILILPAEAKRARDLMSEL